MTKKEFNNEMIKEDVDFIEDYLYEVRMKHPEIGGTTEIRRIERRLMDIKRRIGVL